MAESFMSRFVSAYFRLKRKPTESQAEKELERLKQQGEKQSPLPKGTDAVYEDGIFYVNKDAASDRTVFYMHGGGYQHDFSPFHWRFIKKIVEQTDAAVIAPAYRLIPFGTCRDAFELIVPLYERYCAAHPEKKIILMGDSSGGGLALALAEYFKAEGMRLPDETILLSPWVDVSMENPDIPEYADKDPWLSVPWLKVCGRHWAGSYDIRDYRVSPLFGDVSGLKNITVFLGTRELFYPDVTMLTGLLEERDNELIIGEDMIHVFPILPIPEAEEYREKIFGTIRRDSQTLRASRLSARMF